MNPFSIFGDAQNRQVNNLPKAAEEHKIIMRFHNQTAPIADNFKGANYATVTGYMTNEFTYSSTGNYKNIWENNFPENVLTRAISDETQRNLMNYGYMTKKMYSSGESPIINLEFMCYAGDDIPSTNMGDGFANDPIAIAKILINATLPKVSNDNLLLTESVVDTAKSLAGGIATAFMGGVEVAGKTIADVASGNGISTETFTNYASNELNQISSHKPPVCELKIGNIFHKDMMVVKRVEATMSKEYLAPGIPLYGKYSVTLESLYNAANITGGNDKEAIFGSGLIIQDGKYKGRVSFEDGAQ